MLLHIPDINWNFTRQIYIADLFGGFLAVYLTNYSIQLLEKYYM